MVVWVLTFNKTYIVLQVNFVRNVSFEHKIQYIMFVIIEEMWKLILRTSEQHDFN